VFESAEPGFPFQLDSLKLNIPEVKGSGLIARIVWQLFEVLRFRLWLAFLTWLASFTKVHGQQAESVPVTPNRNSKILSYMSCDTRWAANPLHHRYPSMPGQA
jgi:hypothetical protein